MTASVSLGFVHTVGSLQPLFAALAAELLPGVRDVHVVDESLLAETIASGGVSPDIETRLRGYVNGLADAGVSTVMVTCSSMGQAVDAIAATTQIPVFRVDAAMAEQAVATGRRVGVLATLRTTMTPTAELIAERGRVAGQEIEVVTHLCDGAFDALNRGDVARHDELVRAGLRQLEPALDVVVLAQASMARVLSGREVSSVAPILSSPRTALGLLASVVAGARGRDA
jgi:aspartate/glutamate racemase